MISNFHWKKLKKKQRRPKIRPKLGQNWKKLVKDGYYVHFETKKYMKKYKIGVFYNKKKHDNLLSVEKKNKKKLGMSQNEAETGPKFVKIGKNW